MIDKLETVLKVTTVYTEQVTKSTVDQECATEKEAERAVPENRNDEDIFPLPRDVDCS